MTAYPTPENHGRWWVTTWKGWNRSSEMAKDPDRAGYYVQGGDWSTTRCDIPLDVMLAALAAIPETPREPDQSTHH